MTTQKKGMAAKFTEVSLEDMDKFLKRAFRVLRPTQGQARGEYYYDLRLGKFVGIRVWTSVGLHSGTGAGAGADAIRVHLVSLKDNGPLERGKAPIVKRTQGWRNSLQEKIEELAEKFEEREDFWEQWAETRQRSSGPERAMEQHREETEDELADRETQPVHTPTPRPEYQREIPLEKLRGEITDKQVGFIRSMLKSVDHNKWRELGLDSASGFDRIPTNVELGTLSKRQASAVIDILLKAGYGSRRYAAESEPST